MRSVEEWFDGAPRVLFVHAHPDDETIVTGGTIAALAAAGRGPAVVTLTRGEKGEVRPGPFASLQGTPGLASHRENELAAALTALGVSQHVFLGTPPARVDGLAPRVYEDSGMVWGDDGRAIAGLDAGELALTRAAAHEPLADLLTLANEWEVGAIVSYDEGGGYGHPDHVFAHCAARSVAAALDRPFWVIGSTPDVGIAGDADGWVSYDISEWIERKTFALRCHGTQLVVDGDDIVHVGGQRHAIGRTEAFRRITES